MKKKKPPVGTEILNRWEGDLYVLSSQEESSMAAVWTVYFCLRAVADDCFELSTRRYECLGEAHEYFNEEAEDYDLPEEIEGARVVGLDDDLVIGGELLTYNEDETKLFRDISDQSLEEWLRNKEFHYPLVRNLVDAALEEVAQRPNVGATAAD